MKVKLDEGAIVPTRAHSTDAGLDLYSPKAHYIPFGDSAAIDTGVHVEIPAGYVGMIKSKSGLNVKRNLTSEGVIDAGYTGITPEIELVDDLEETERGNNGFGSTGK